MTGRDAPGRVARWADLAWPDVPAAVRQRPVALLPLGAIEAHGPHLAVGADWFAADALADRLALRADLLLMPTIPYGQVWSLERFPGSLSVRDRTLTALIVDLARGMRAAGVAGLVLLSAHLGNAAAMRAAIRELAEDPALPAISLTYPGLSEVEHQVADTPRSHPAIMHADELETSVLLALAPEHVDLSRAAPDYPTLPADFDVAPIRWDEISETGVFGDPTTASAAKGERIVDHVVRTAADLIAAWRERVGL
jgi:creatinine amidohydrolase